MTDLKIEYLPVRARTSTATARAKRTLKSNRTLWRTLSS